MSMKYPHTSYISDHKSIEEIDAEWEKNRFERESFAMIYIMANNNNHTVMDAWKSFKSTFLLAHSEIYNDLIKGLEADFMKQKVMKNTRDYLRTIQLPPMPHDQT